MSSTAKVAAAGGDKTRFVIVAVLLLGAFFGAYRFAQARTGVQTAPSAAFAESGPSQTSGQPAAAGSGEDFTSACACCGSSQPTNNGVTGAENSAAATVSGGTQKVSVDVSQGFYQPNVIVVKAGTPVEITFGQGSGCTGQVQSSELGFSADISGGPQTVKLPALEKGEYPFYCGMKMVFGKLVVK